MEGVQRRILQRHTQLDMDPLNNAQQRNWWLLYAGDRAELHFSGTRLGFLTMIGPDAGIVQCDIDGGEPPSPLHPAGHPCHCAWLRAAGKWSCRLNLLDKWAYFWRLAVVALVEELPPGPHVAVLTFLPERPDRALLKRKPGGPHWEQFRREGKEHKLWMMHWLIEEESDRERAVTPFASGGAVPKAKHSARLGGVSGVSTGGRKADA